MAAKHVVILYLILAIILIFFLLRRVEHFGNAPLEHQALCLQKKLPPGIVNQIIASYQGKDEKKITDLMKDEKTNWFLSRCRFSDSEGNLSKHHDFTASDPYDRKLSPTHEGFKEGYCGSGDFRLYDKHGCCAKKHGTSDWPGLSQCILSGEGMERC